MTGPAPQFAISVTESSGSPIVAVAGDIDVASAPALGQCLSQCIADGCSEITVDMTDVTFMDSSGIAVLIAAMRQLSALGGTLTLANPTRPVRRVLDVSALSSVFTITGGEADGSP